MEYLFVYILFCVIVGAIASSTTLGFWSAALLSGILTPLVGFIIVLFYPSKSKRDEQIKALNKIANSTFISQADEIEKLKKLLDSGAITNDEFETAKKKIFT